MSEKPHSKRHFWTLTEGAYVKRHAGKLSALVMAEVLDIPVEKVRDYARRNGIQLKRHGAAIESALLNGLLIDMLTILQDAGYTANQMKKAFNLKASTSTINSAISGMTWNGREEE